MPAWGFLAGRIDERIAVSERARDSAARWLPGRLRGRPERRPHPATPSTRRAGAHGHLRRPARAAEGPAGAAAGLAGDPSPHRRAAAGLRLGSPRGAAPPTRLRVADDGIDILGFLRRRSSRALLSRTKALVAPSLGGESFGMVLTRAFACALPVVASDIPGYREVTTPETSVTSRRTSRRRSPTRSRRCSTTSRARARWARGPRARRRALLLGRHRAAARGDLRARARATGRRAA